MKKIIKITGKLFLVLVLSIMIILSIPKLLSASNDFAVILGGFLTLTFMYFGWFYWKQILNFFGIKIKRMS